MKQYEYKLHSEPIRCAHSLKIAGYSNILVTESPFGNCQLFTVGKVHYVTKGNVDVRKLMKVIKKIVDGKKLMLLDINDRNLIDIKKFFEPFIEKFSIKPYRNTNGSKMFTCHVYLNKAYEDL